MILLLGETREELSGSEWAWVAHRHLGGSPPRVDLAAERRLAELIGEARRRGLIRTAHDLSEGGLAQALVECCLRHDLGATVALPADWAGDPFTFLFSESAGRALVSVPIGHEKAFTALCDEHGLPWAALGLVGAAGAPLEITDQFELPLAELRAAWSGTLPAIFG